MTEPIVIRQTAQPASGSSGLSLIPPHVACRIRFKGELAGEEPKFLSVLANEQGVTATEGWAKWARVPRPQRVAMTVLEGYEPMTLTVPILFDAVAGAIGREDVEYNIQVLEWMAGRGILFTPQNKGGVGAPGQGDSPLIEISTVDASGSATQLIPKQYQTKDIRWVITGIEYDTSPLRDHGGARLRQAAVVTLTEHVGSPGTSLDSAAARSKARAAASQKAPKVFTTTAGVNTVERVSVFFAHNSAHNTRAIREIIEANRDNRKIGSDPEKKLKPGTQIKVPITAFSV